MNKVAIYIRVSDEKQTEESQLEPCEQFCKEKKYIVYGVFKDYAKSAYHNVKRKKYDEVLKLVKERKIQHVVVWALDRWTRKGAKELRNTIDYLAKYGVQLHSVREHWIDEITTPSLSFVKDIILEILGWMAHEESKVRSDRVRTSVKFQKAVAKGKVGRPKIPVEIKEKVGQLLLEGKSYSYIQENVTYKAKYGKIKHISAPTISEIKKSLLEKANKNYKGKKEEKSVLKLQEPYL